MENYFDAIATAIVVLTYAIAAGSAVVVVFTGAV
jgi:hypothetical protein